MPISTLLMSVIGPAHLADKGNVRLNQILARCVSRFRLCRYAIYDMRLGHGSGVQTQYAIVKHNLSRLCVACVSGDAEESFSALGSY